MILILGSDGSMGKRYQAILNFLKKPFFCRDIKLVDAPQYDVPFSKLKEIISGIIIATPTETHADLIRDFLPFKKPILCEKPILKDLTELRSLFKEIESSKIRFHMMYQYKSLVPKYSEGESVYDYFRHGSDGLLWDCLQIIGLAKGKIKLRERSPIWECKINGHRIPFQFMDRAYIIAVESWINGHSQDLKELLTVHEKVARFENS